MSATVVLSNGGASMFRGAGTDRLIVGTVDGVFVLERQEKGWREAGRALEGSSVGAVAQLPSGTLLSATHGLGVGRSTDGGATWNWSNRGLPQFDLWSVRGGVIGGEAVAVVVGQEHADAARAELDRLREAHGARADHDDVVALGHQAATASSVS